MTNSSLRTFLIGMLLIGTLSACSDHRLRPLSPLNLRLKTVGQTTITYDQGNRVASYDGNAKLFFYDEQSRYSRYEIPSTQNPGQYDFARFTYPVGSNAFSVDLYTFNGASENKFGSKFYTVDDSKRVTGFSVAGSLPFERQTYQYTGDNITAAELVLGRNLSNRLYEYDDKPNPYYGLIQIGIDELRTYSRNNVTKITELTREGTPIIVAEFVYEYNERGLPTKVTNKDGTGEVRFTYESF